MGTTTVPSVRPRRAGDPQVDLRLYSTAHLSMKHGSREVAALAEKLRRGADRLTVKRAKALETYVRIFTEDIRLHHHNEDEVGFPIIVASAGTAVDISPLNSDHDQLDPILDALDAASHTLCSAPADTAALATLADQSVRLRDLLEEHIAEEERDLFPAILEYVSVVDFKRWEGIAVASTPKNHLWFLIPWAVAAIPPEDIAATFRLTPPPFRIIYRLFKGKYARLHRTIFG